MSKSKHTEVSSKPETDEAKQQDGSSTAIADDSGSAAKKSTADTQTAGQSDTQTVTKTRKSGLGLVWLVLLLLIGGLGAGGYLAWSWFQQHDFGVLQTVREDGQAQQTALNDIQSALQAESRARSQLQSELAQANASTQAEINRQGARMTAIASLSTDDWRLAEAEYLLRLASQRLAMQQSDNVLPLLTRADTILRALDDTKVLPVRRTLAADIAALKMAGSVDREGLYLRLSALKDIMGKLSITPDPEVATGTAAADQSVSQAQGNSGDESGLSEEPVAASRLKSAWNRFSDNAGSAFDSFSKEHLQVRSLGAPLQPLMAPEQEIYLRQNLQLMISQAQLALLERQPAIYRDSLNNASQWLKAFFQLDNQANFVVEELAQLERQPISTRLPDISASVESLKQYVDGRANRHSPDSGSAAP
ncbi:MAG: uroporphyrinogen-III C-methyltransferase [Porticoccaceae bacterium]